MSSKERFAEATFKKATLTTHADNLTVFDEIRAARANVFGTEAAEALAQQKLKPGLCAIKPESRRSTARWRTCWRATTWR